MKNKKVVIYFAYAFIAVTAIAIYAAATKINADVAHSSGSDTQQY